MEVEPSYTRIGTICSRSPRRQEPAAGLPENLRNLVHNAVIPSNKTTRNSVSFDGKYNINKSLSVTSQASWSHTFVPNQSHVQDKREDNPLAHAMSMPINMPKMS